MQIFQEVQKSFISMGFSPEQELFNRTILGIFAMIVMGVTSLWIFLIQEAVSAQEYMESIYIITTGTGVLLSFASTVFIKQELFSFIKNGGEFANENLESPIPKAICEETNELVEKCSRIGIYGLKYVAVPSYIFSRVAICFFIYFTTDAGNDALDLPASMWLPFDWKNPTGYLAAVFVQISFTTYPFQYSGCFMFLAFGAFMFAIAFVKILKHDLHAINEMARDTKSVTFMHEKLSKFIRTHADLKQMIASFSDCYEITLTIVFAGCVIALCVVMLLFQIEISHNETDSIVLLEAGVFGAAALILLSFVCELGQRFSEVTHEINEKIIRLDWYLFPGEMQRVLPIIMQSTQKPSVIKCFGNVSCAREQLKKVVKTAYTYFMTLRKFYQ